MNADDEVSPDDMIMVKRSEWDRLRNQTIQVDGRQLTVTTTMCDSRGNDINAEKSTPEYQAQELYGKPYRVGYNFHSKHFTMSLPNKWWVHWFIIPILKRIAIICNATDWDKNTKHG
jgi:hypothetical protein